MVHLGILCIFPSAGLLPYPFQHGMWLLTRIRQNISQAHWAIRPLVHDVSRKAQVKQQINNSQRTAFSAFGFSVWMESHWANTAVKRLFSSLIESLSRNGVPLSEPVSSLNSKVFKVLVWRVKYVKYFCFFACLFVCSASTANKSLL